MLSVGAMLVLMVIAVPSMDGGTVESGKDDLATSAFNEGRQAIQVNGCNDQIAAHLPLRQTQLDALLDGAGAPGGSRLTC